MRFPIRAVGPAFALAAVLAPSQAAAQAADAENGFTYEFHGTAQYDAASYMQSARAAALPIGGQLSSGGVWRRLWARVSGTAFTDWSYIFEIQGNTTGTTAPITVRQAYVEYDGWGALALRAGAYIVSTGMEGSSPSTSSMLLERTSVGTMQRSIGGGPTTGAAMLYTGRDFYASLALSIAPLADTPLDFEKHSAVAARVADVVYRDSESAVALAASSTGILRVAEAPGGTMRRLQLNGNAELYVDTTRLTSTGSVDADNAWSWGLESAGAWRNFFAEAGYARFGINRRQTLSDFGRNYEGYYLGASWILTGEQRRWSPANGAFAGPAPSRPVDKGGMGAFELTVRYSDLNLNDNSGEVGSALPPGGSRGGDQDILGLGLNWTPNDLFRFALQFQDVWIDRIGALGADPNADIGQNYQTLALRSQFTF